MTTRRGLFVAPFDVLADPRVVGDLAASAEAAGWDGFFLWDHLQYGERVTEIADPWTCCAAVAMRTERLLFGPMVTPLPRRRPQVLARQAASLAVLSGGRFVLGLGLGDDWVGEFGAFGDEPDPKVRGRMLDEGLDVLTALLAGEVVDHAGDHYAARDVRFLPAPDVPIWLAGRLATGRRCAAPRGTTASSSSASTGPPTSTRWVGSSPSTGPPRASRWWSTCSPSRTSPRGSTAVPRGC
ncbi:LLM class flavin-dependent oxidoreductase [Nocardioides sp.]|uniref:LLM class flavin-dependent oxidoreductase n=1 Tax=Nocardioides sp. TaxID=35761 RepID=UPI002639790E|nr:LLM class flavin-dependent oxidoreductase [Nocardioides sp.]